jgi:large subunit ribosomal protein L28
MVLLPYHSRVMSKVCQLSGQRPSVGHNVSHSNRKTKRRFEPNLITKKLIEPATGKKIKVKMSVRALKTMVKNPSAYKTELAKISRRTKK